MKHVPNCSRRCRPRAPPSQWCPSLPASPPRPAAAWATQAPSSPVGAALAVPCKPDVCWCLNSGLAGAMQLGLGWRNWSRSLPASCLPPGLAYEPVHSAECCHQNCCRRQGHCPGQDPGAGGGGRHCHQLSSPGGCWGCRLPHLRGAPFTASATGLAACSLQLASTPGQSLGTRFHKRGVPGAVPHRMLPGGRLSLLLRPAMVFAPCTWC